MNTQEVLNENAEYPNQVGYGLPPSPSRENPGQVYPRYDIVAQSAEPSPSPSTSQLYIGNPYLMQGAFQKLDRALAEVIDILVEEQDTVIASSTEERHTEDELDRDDPQNMLLKKFQDWRDELVLIRMGHPIGNANGNAQPSASITTESIFPSTRRAPQDPIAREGGLFTD